MKRIPASKKFLLIGEIHGVRENLDILKCFIIPHLAKKKKITVGFEWPARLSQEINDYISGKTKKIFPRKWKFAHNRDGRISKEHVQFLSWLRKNKITVLCFDESLRSWNERDRAMAQNLQKASGNIIAITGNLHARKRKFVLDKESSYLLHHGCRPSKP